MLSAYPRSPTGDTSLKDAAWIDLVDPTEAERSAFEQAFALRVPTKDELAEIETTSRLRVERDALYLTAPLVLANENEPWTVLPTGFVLAKNVLLTVRFAQLPAFDRVIAELGESAQCAPALAFVRLIEFCRPHGGPA